MFDKLMQAAVVAATVATIVFNWLAATGILGGVRTNVISDRNPTLITPAGYAFAIWSLIYLGMIAFSFYQALPAKAARFRTIRPVYIVSALLNCAWLYFWAHDRLGLCLALIALLGAALLLINRDLTRTDTAGELWLAKAPFGIYLGWVTAATLVNLMIALAAGGSALAVSQTVAAGFVLLAAALAVGARLWLVNYFFPLAVAWALTAIAVKQSGVATLVVAACAVGVIACLLASVSFVLSMPAGNRSAGVSAGE